MTQNVTTRKISLSVHTKQLISRVTEHLESFFRSVIKTEWVIGTIRNEIEVRLRVHARSGSYQAHSRAEQVGEAIRLAADKVERQRRRKKAIGLRKKRQPNLTPAARPARASKRNESLESVSREWED